MVILYSLSGVHVHHSNCYFVQSFGCSYSSKNFHKRTKFCCTRYQQNVIRMKKLIFICSRTTTLTRIDWLYYVRITKRKMFVIEVVKES